VSCMVFKTDDGNGQSECSCGSGLMAALQLAYVTGVGQLVS
jgi:hypothetical protein